MKFLKHLIILLIVVTGTNLLACSLSKEDSRRKLIPEAKKALKEGLMKKAVKIYERHLNCWKDTEALKELAEIYLSQKKFFMAGQTYKKANLFDDFQKVEQLRHKHRAKHGNPKIWKKAYNDAARKMTSSNIRKGFGAVMMFAGPILAGTGFGLLIADNVYGNENNKFLQYAFMVGGLSLTGAGVTLDYSADYNRNISQVYSLISEKYYDAGTTTREYYEGTGMDKIAKKSSVKSLNAHGAGLLMISLPLFAVGVYSFVETYNLYKGGSTSDYDVFFKGMNYAMQVAIFVPAILCVTAGAIMFSKASKFEVLGIDSDQTISLDFIAPKIDPITKTYGISMGFSY